MTSVAVTAVLVTWIFVSFACARAAERRDVAAPPRASFVACGAAVLVACVATLVRAPGSAAACGLTCIALIAAADSDARTGCLFDAVLFPAALLVCVAIALAGDARAALFGASLLAVSFGTVVWASRGRMMGFGDVKALFVIGAAFGPVESLVALFGACASGIVATAVRGKLRAGVALPFGPHLAAGGAFALVAGDVIRHHVMGI